MWPGKSGFTDDQKSSFSSYLSAWLCPNCFVNSWLSNEGGISVSARFGGAKIVRETEN